MEELKQCPFCGGRAKINVWNADLDGYTAIFSYFIACENCEIEFGERVDKNIYVRMSEDGTITVDNEQLEDSIRKWNKRV